MNSTTPFRLGRIAFLLTGVCLFAASPAFGQTTGRTGVGSTGGAGISGGGLTGGGIGGGGIGGGGMGLSGGGLTGGGGISSGNLGGGTFVGSSTSGSYGAGGGGFRGTGSTGMTGVTGNVFPQVPSPQNTFMSSYGNPLAYGQKLTTTSDMLVSTSTGGGSTTATVTAFGQPSLNPQSTSLSTSTTGRTGAYGASTGTSSTSSTGGFNTIGQVRTPSFVTTAPDFPARGVAAPSVVLREATGALTRSSKLTSPSTIQLHLAPDRDTLILSGNVADARERRMAESLVRLTPGVHDVINQLQIVPPTLPAAKVSSAGGPAP
jgi:hypothetical protein